MSQILALKLKNRVLVKETSLDGLSTRTHRDAKCLNMVDAKLTSTTSRRKCPVVKNVCNLVVVEVNFDITYSLI